MSEPLRFQVLEIRDRIPEGWGLATVAQVLNLDAGSSISESDPINKLPNEAVLGTLLRTHFKETELRIRLRLKNGSIKQRKQRAGEPAAMHFKVVRQPPSIFHPRIEYKLIIEKDVRRVTKKEDCIHALLFACETDDVDAELEDIVKHAEDGEAVLSKWPTTVSECASILHVCTQWGAIDTLTKILEKYPEAVDVALLDTDNETAIHNLPNRFDEWEERPGMAKYEVCKSMVMMLLRHHAKQNPSRRIHSLVNAILSYRSVDMYDKQTVVFKCMRKKQEVVCKALLVGATEVIKGQDQKQQSADDIVTDDEELHWLTFQYDAPYYSYGGARWMLTVVHFAVLREWAEVVDALLNYPGAHAIDLTSLQDSDGDTALHLKIDDEHIRSSLLRAMTPKAAKSVNAQSQNLLHIATMAGWPAEHIERLFELRVPVDQKDLSGQYPLTNAYLQWIDSDDESDREDQLALIHKLLDHILGVQKKKTADSATTGQVNSINTKFELDLTALHVAASICSPDHVQKLCKAGADLQIRSGNGMTPLHLAASASSKISNKKKTLKQLILSWLTQNFGESGESISSDAKLSISSDATVGPTAANRARHLNAADKLMSWINKQDSDSGRAALHYIVNRGRGSSESEQSNRRMCLYLLKCGANKMIKDSKGETVLHIATRMGSAKVINALIMANHDDIAKELRKLSGDSDTAVHQKYRSYLESEVFSDDEGDDSDEEADDSDDITSIQNVRDVDVAFIAMPDFSGETALHEAARKGNHKIVKLLLEATRKSNELAVHKLLRVRDNEKKTAFYWVVKNRSMPIAKLMLDFGTGSSNYTTARFLLWNVQSSSCASRLNEQSRQWMERELIPEIQRNYSELTHCPDGLIEAAAKERDLDMVREMMNAGEDVTTCDPHDLKWVSKSLARKASDRPTLEDTLERKSLVQGVANLLLNPYTETPISIGVFGGWGSGKSSFMFQVEQALLCMAIQETFKRSTKDKTRGALREKVMQVLGRYVQEKGTSEILRETTMFYKIKETLKCLIGDKGHKSINLISKEEDIFEKLTVQLQLEHQQLFKNLALMDRSKLVKAHTLKLKKRRKHGHVYQALDDTQVTGQTPTMLTIQYNVWQYANKIEASAGLAVEISRELEDFMTPAQWLRMCWQYSWNRSPSTVFIQLLLPIMLAFVVIFVIAILWSQTHIYEAYKFFSLPVGIVGVTWVFYTNLIKVVQPVTQTIMNVISHPDNKSMLGYQHQVINDILFLKDQLCKEAHLGWVILGIIAQFFIPNSTFFIDTGYRWPWLTKQSPVANNLRVVVFIDDLDRCDEKTILELLRTVNLILGACGISVVIGVDKVMLQHAIGKEFFKDVDSSDKLLETLVENKNPMDISNAKSKNKDDEKNNINPIKELAEKYMQKIIQIPIEMPEPSNESLQLFLEGQLGVNLPNNLSMSSNMPNREANQSKSSIERDNDSSDDYSSRIQRDDYSDDDASGNNNSNHIGVEIDESIVDIGDDNHVKANNNEGKVAFTLLLANYSPIETEMLKKLCNSIKDGNKKSPREWKRFLNYHRLAWTILSQDPDMQKAGKYKGWERKLILWIFVCWHWRHEMDIIIENWNQLLQSMKDNNHSQKTKINQLRRGQGDALGNFVYPYTTKTRKDKAEEKVTHDPWVELHETLKADYDIPLHFIKKFEKFRFYCKLNHLGTYE